MPALPHTQDTVIDLKKRFHSANRKYYPERQWYNLIPKAGESRGQALEDDKTLGSYGLSDGSSIVFKDLGTQARTLARSSATLSISLIDRT